MSNDNVELKRSLNFPLLTLYGIGTIIGAGIFVLIGKVAGVAGMQGPLAFLMAAVLAGISAFSFAELSSRFPYSAGEAFYVREAFGRNDLALAVGLGVVLAGIISAGTIVNGFVGYFREFADLPGWLRRAARLLDAPDRSVMLGPWITFFLRFLLPSSRFRC